jgi:hypothetical protein
MKDQLIDSCRLLVGVLLDHTTLQEGTDLAVSGFLSSDDTAPDLLRHIIEAQRAEREDGRR